LVEYNPLLPEVRANPYPTYARMRAEAPVLWMPLILGWLLTRYDDVLAVLRDHARFSSDRRRSNHPLIQQTLAMEGGSSPVFRAPTMLGADPPAHTRMRNLVNKAFTPRAVEAMRPRIQALADELLDAAGPSFDLIGDFAAPLPIIVIAEMLGVSPNDRGQFRAWSNAVAGTLDRPVQTQADVDRARDASNAIADYFTPIIRARRADPKDDLLSALVAAEEGGDLLSEDELLATLILLLVAGNETTSNLIGNGMLALLKNRDQLRLLQDDPTLINGAVEELVRYDSPVQATARIALEPADVGGTRVEAGQIVVAFVGAANHDPAHFTDPERLDLRRADNRHLSFGQGIHYCLGAPLARAEAQIAISTLLRRLPDIETPIETPVWRTSFVLRGLESLPVTASGVAAK
jgi:cytochrome P450